MVLRISILSLVVTSLLLNYVVVDMTTSKKNYEGFFAKGILVPVFTSFENKTTEPCEFNNINPKIIKEYAEVLAKANVTAVLVNGITGEGASLTLSESKILLQTWVKEAQSLGLKVIAQVGLLISVENYELAVYAESLGVDAIAVLPPIINKPQSVHELVADVKIVADCAKNTPILYFNSVITNVKVSLYQFIPLASAQIPTFQGVITNLETALEVRAAFAIKEPQYLIINKHISTQATVALGFKASISAAYNIAPDIAVMIQKDENRSTEAALQEKLNKIIFSIAEPSKYLAALKAAFTIIFGISLGDTRPPLVAATYEDRKYITAQLEKQGVSLKSPVV